MKRVSCPRSARCWTWFALVLGTTAGAVAEPFSFAALQARARALAREPHRPAATTPVPEWLQRLSYDEHRIIEYNAAQSLWRRERLPFQVQFFHPGNLFNQPVEIFELSDGAARRIGFRREYFNYHRLKVRDVPDSLGFAGFRLLYPLNRPNDELGAFLGASYFRLLCARAAYGLSARGLALNTAEPEPEEFPRFSEFWLERPADGATRVTVYALLDSPSVTGAYRFVISPGAVTLCEVSASITLRHRVKTLGVAPLTSMFWRGEATRDRGDDFRPEVHDSDGLLMHRGNGEWMWRPLSNPSRVRTVAFEDTGPRGFGLLQRDRQFENYQDIEAAYQLRPGAWIEPRGDWGKGTVRLVELPTRDEFNDNIVAFWVPASAPAPGETLDLEYRIHWFMDQIGPPLARAVGTRHARGLAHESEMERFVIDFEGAELADSPEDAKIGADVTVTNGEQPKYVTVQKNPFNRTWRVSFGLARKGREAPVELRCVLREGSRAVSETWSFLWQP